MDDYAEEYGPADLGDVTMGKLIEKHEKIPHSTGLASLLKVGGHETPSTIKATRKIETFTTELQNFDPMILNEILRVVRQKDNNIEKRFDLIEAHLKNNESKIKIEKKYLLSLLSLCLVIGAFFGASMQSPSLQVSEIEPKNEIVIPKVKKQIMITKKFVNLRQKNSPRASKILTIAPAQEVEVLAQNNGWIKVKYTNKLTGKVHIGHLWDEYLKKI